MESKRLTVSQIRRHNAVLRRAIKREEKILMLQVEAARLSTRLTDLSDFNTNRINGKPEDFMPQLRPIVKDDRGY